MNCHKKMNRFLEIFDEIEDAEKKIINLKSERRLLEKELASKETGSGYSGDSESGVFWATYPGSMDFDSVKEAWRRSGRDWDHHSSGPGASFNHTAWIKRSKDRIIVRQFVGLDI